MQQTILVVDDSQLVLDVTRARLEEAGYRVITHTRATGSVALILQTKPDLVLLDVNMPSMKGDAVARMAASTALSEGTRVVLHSSLGVRDLERLARESGATGYIQKTDNAYALVRQIKTFLDDRSSAVFKAASRVEGPVSDPISRTTRTSGGRVLLVDRDMTELAHHREMIRHLGLQTDFALSKEQAERKLRTPPAPHAIVASSKLPLGGAFQLFDVASTLDLDLRGRFIVTVPRGAHLRPPSKFRGILLELPIDERRLATTLGLEGAHPGTSSADVNTR